MDADVPPVLERQFPERGAEAVVGGADAAEDLAQHVRGRAVEAVLAGGDFLRPVLLVVGLALPGVGRDRRRGLLDVLGGRREAGEGLLGGPLAVLGLGPLAGFDTGVPAVGVPVGLADRRDACVLAGVGGEHLGQVPLALRAGTRSVAQGAGLVVEEDDLDAPAGGGFDDAFGGLPVLVGAPLGGDRGLHPGADLVGAPQDGDEEGAHAGGVQGGGDPFEGDRSADA